MTHHHHHDHEIRSSLSFDEKMIKLLDHWIKHNDDHAETYKNWANKAKENDLADAAVLLEDAAEMTLLINKKFENAVKQIQNN